MKKRAFITVLFLQASVWTYAQQADDDFTGRWKTDNGKIVVITKEGDHFTGKSEDGKYTILKNVKFEDGQWQGTVSKPGSDREVDCQLELTGKGLQLTAGIGFISKTLLWTKAK